MLNSIKNVLGLVAALSIGSIASVASVASNPVQTELVKPSLYMEYMHGSDAVLEEAIQQKKLNEVTFYGCYNRDGKILIKDTEEETQVLLTKVWGQAKASIFAAPCQTNESVSEWSKRVDLELEEIEVVSTNYYFEDGTYTFEGANKDLFYGAMNQAKILMIELKRSTDQ